MTEKTIVFWVSPSGNDTWTGRFPVVRASGQDGPFQTVIRAQEAVRDLRALDPVCHIVIRFREGHYRFAETLVFDERDAGDPGTLTLCAHDHERVVFSGGIPVTAWSPCTKLPPGMDQTLAGKIWQAPIPADVEDFKVLFHYGKRLPRACGEGFNPLTQDVSGPQYQMVLEHAEAMNQFQYPENAVRAWPNLCDIEVVTRPSFPWVMNILGLTAVDEKNAKATTHVLGTYALNPVKNRTSMWIENAPESLTEPGEWIVNTQERVIYYYPEDGKDPGDTVTVPATQVLIKVQGQVNAGAPVDKPIQGIHFERICFTQGDRGTWNPEDAGIQHDWEMLDKDDALLRFRAVENCEVRQCTFHHSGASAIRFDLHAQNNLVEQCSVHDMGGAGILFIGYGPGKKDVNKYNIVRNNHIFRIGRIYWHSHGIILWQSGHNRVYNNLIHDVPRKAICMSGVRVWFFNQRLKDLRECAKSIRWHEMGDATTWEEILPFLHTRYNVVEYNEAFHCLQKLGDGGVMNISGAGPGNTIRRNYIHDICTQEWTDGVLRTDDCQCGSVIEENIVFNSDASALVLKGENTARNNYFINNGRKENASVRITEDNRSTVFSHNIIIKGKDKTSGRKGDVDRYQWNDLIYAPLAEPDFPSQVLPTVENLKDCTLDNNVLFSEWAGPQGSPELQAYIKAGHEIHSRIEDPLLEDWKNGKFEHQEGSPIEGLGIEALNLDNVGLQQPLPLDLSDD